MWFSVAGKEQSITPERWQDDLTSENDTKIMTETEVKEVKKPEVESLSSRDLLSQPHPLRILHILRVIDVWNERAGNIEQFPQARIKIAEAISILRREMNFKG